MWNISQFYSVLTVFTVLVLLTVVNVAALTVFDFLIWSMINDHVHTYQFCCILCYHSEECFQFRIWWFHLVEIPSTFQITFAWQRIQKEPRHISTFDVSDGYRTRFTWYFYSTPRIAFFVTFFIVCHPSNVLACMCERPKVSRQVASSSVRDQI